MGLGRARMAQDRRSAAGWHEGSLDGRSGLVGRFRRSCPKPIVRMPLDRVGRVARPGGEPILLGDCGLGADAGASRVSCARPFPPPPHHIAVGAPKKFSPKNFPLYFLE